MTKLIMHIGEPKTGTTTLQSTLWRSRHRLLRHGILYPSNANGHNHTGAVYHLSDRRFTPRYAISRFEGDNDALYAFSGDMWQRIVEEVSTHNPDTIILSSETFFDFGNVDAVTPLLEKTKRLAQDITVVCYLREPASVYLSLKQQNLKTAHVDPPPGPNTRMRTALEPFLGIDGVTLEVHKFDRNQLIGNDVVQDFATRYLPPGMGADLVPGSNELNTALSAEMMAVCEDILAGAAHPRLRPHHGFPRTLWGRLPLIDAAVPQFRPARLKPGIAHIIQNQSQDLGWVEDTFGISFDRPAMEPAIAGTSPESLVSTRDLCPIDEKRYQDLLSSFPSPLELSLRSSVAKRKRILQNRIRRFGQNALRVSRRLGF